MPEPFATAAELASAWRPLTSAEETPADTLLGFASTLLRHYVTDIDDRITAGTLDADLAKLAVIEMVKRALINPNGLRSETTGPFTATWGDAVGRLQVTTADLNLVRHTGGSRVRNMSLRPGLL